MRCGIAPPFAGCNCRAAGDGTVNQSWKYLYMADLRAMDACRPLEASGVPDEVGVVSSPLVANEWETVLAGHPDREFAEFVVRGIREGFRIGFDYICRLGEKIPKNMRSASENRDPIDRYVRAEAQERRLIRLVGAAPVRVSRVGVIPKPHQPGKWRLITDLSFPKGQSVNDGIGAEVCSVSYATVDQAVRCIKTLGRGALLAKFDIANAYRAVPVHPSDRLLLGLSWRGDTFVDGALPFGLRSAPKLVADALLWAIGRRNVVHAMHYLDDFLIVGPPNSSECSRALQESLRLCDRLGFPIAPHKLEGPASRLAFLGILIDSENDTLSLPADKCARLRVTIAEWRGRKFCKKRELLSLIGQLQHACRVVRAGRTFLRRMIDLSLGPGTNCSAIFGKYGQAGAIKKYRQLGWEISVNWRPERAAHLSFCQRGLSVVSMCMRACPLFFVRRSLHRRPRPWVEVQLARPRPVTDNV